MFSSLVFLEHRLHDLQTGFEATTSMLKKGEGPDREVCFLILEELNRQFRAVVADVEAAAGKRAVLSLVR